MRSSTAVTLFALIVLGACATSKGEGYLKPDFQFDTVQRVAVVSGEASFHVKTRQALVDAFQYEFFRRGWNVIERADIQSGLDELEFQNSDFTSQEDRRQYGEVFNVDALVVVNVTEQDNDLSMVVKMFDVGNGELLWMGTGEGSPNSGLATMTGTLIGAAVGVAAGDSSGNEVAGGVVGAIAGGMLGRSMSPSELENAKKVVAKVCESLPTR